MSSSPDQEASYEKKISFTGLFIYALLLAPIVGWILFVDNVNHRYILFFSVMSTVVFLLAASVPYLCFLAVRANKRWILDEWGIRHDGRKKNRSEPTVACKTFISVFSMMQLTLLVGTPIFTTLCFIIAIFLVYVFSITLPRVLGMYDYFIARTSDEENGKTETNSDAILEGLYRASRKIQRRYIMCLIAFFASWLIIVGCFFWPSAHGSRDFFLMLALLISIVFISLLYFFITKFILENMILYETCIDHGFIERTSLGKKTLKDFWASQVKFTERFCAYFLMPVIYCPAFFLTYQYMSALVQGKK
jgi:hypothetical protein